MGFRSADDELPFAHGRFRPATEACMQKLLTSFAAAAALVLFASAGQACDWHDTQAMASADRGEQSVAMSTHDGPPPPIVTDEAAKAAQAAPKPACPAGAKDCAPADK